MNKKMLNNKRNRIVLALIVGFLVLLLLLILVIKSFKNYGQIKISTNQEAIFSHEDLVVNDLKFGSTEEEVKKELGEPKSKKEEVKGIYQYRIYEYSGLTLTLKENYEKYLLVKAEITSVDYKATRNIKVGNKITSVFEKFRVDNEEGAYIYGNYTKKALTNKEVKGNIYFGLRTNENVLLVNRDSEVENIPTNIAKMNIEYDHGVIKKITWSYDVE